MVDNERLRQLQEAEAACEAEAVAAAKAVAYRSELRHRLEIQASTAVCSCTNSGAATTVVVPKCIVFRSVSICLPMGTVALRSTCQPYL